MAAKTATEPKRAKVKRATKKPSPKKTKKKSGWFVYLLECENGRLYTGITNDLAKRFAKHLSGKGAMFTRLNRPARILASKPCKNRSEASRLEYRVKGMPKSKKLSGFSALGAGRDYSVGI